MSKVETAPVTPAATAKKESSITWKHFAPIFVALVIALIPAPAGLPQYAWYYVAIFAGVIVGLMFEPLPGGAIGLIGVALVTVLSEYVFFSPEQLAKTGFSASRAALSWALSGFSNSTVWLIFGAFMFALGYDKTGLGRRIALLLVKAMGRKTLTLGYAVMIADTLLAPFTPSNTARSGGTIYPVIRNLPLLYDSKPNDPSMRRVGSYIMWVAIAATCVTSSLFLTALAPNLLAAELVRKIAKIEFAWMEWFMAFAPVGILLLVLIPLLTYWIYPPEVKEGAEVPAWAAQELNKMGGLTQKEITLGVLVIIALLLWIFGGNIMEATTAAYGCDLPDADPQRCQLGRYHGQQSGMEHAGMVCDPGRVSRWSDTRRFCQVVCGKRCRPTDRRFPYSRGRDAAADQLLRPLSVRQCYRARDRDDPGAARRGIDDSRRQHANPCTGHVSAARYHGHPHAVRDRAEPRLLRQRLFARGGLLAPRRDFWRRLFCCVSRHRRTLDAGHTVSAARYCCAHPPITPVPRETENT
jgi:hypothetical protein